MNLLVQLASLESDGLIALGSAQTEATYLFRHALIQEAAYLSLVRRDRQRLHRVVGEALEQSPDAPDLAPVLARHFAEAGEAARALRYYALAGQAAAAVFANAEAIQSFTAALELGHAHGAEPGVMLDVYLRRGRALELNAQDDEALTNYEALEAWATAAGDRTARLAALNARATIYVRPSVEQNLPLGLALCTEALALARELGDRPAEARVKWNLLLYYSAELKLEEALAAGEAALVIARDHGLRELTAYVLNDLQKVFYGLGQLDRGQAGVEEAQSIWRELGAHNMLADNLASTALMHVMTGQYENALALSDEALELSQAIGNLWNQAYARYLIDMVHFERGDIAQALEVAEACRQMSKQAGFADGFNQASFDLAAIYGYMGALERALMITRELRARADAQAGRAHAWPLAEALYVRLLLLGGWVEDARAALTAAAITDDVAELRLWFPTAYLLVVEAKAGCAAGATELQSALEMAQDVIDHFQKNQVRFFLADALLLQSRLLRALGHEAEAHAALESARVEAVALGSRRALWMILADLADGEARRGAADTDRSLRREAAEIVDYIAAHAGSAELAATFRAMPAVRRVLTD